MIAITFPNRETDCSSIHTLLWFANGDDKLEPYAREAIIAAADNGFVSLASIWEIAI